MTFRRRLLLFSGTLLFSLAVVTGVSVYSAYHYRKIQFSMFLGMELQLRSREVMSLMKDLIFDLFSPQLYGHVRSLTYSPRSSVTLRQWVQAVDSYMAAFDQFMSSPMDFSGRDEELKDQYETATRMNATAMAKLARMEEILFTVQTSGVEEENLYSRMQKDDTLIPFFNEIQETSYYFTNSFESFMSYFIRSYGEYGERLQRRTLYGNIVVAVIVILGALTFILLLSKDLLKKIRLLENAFILVSRGDFSHPLNPGYNDEFGELGRRFDELSSDLKKNVESILDLTRNIGAALENEVPEAVLQELIVQAVTRDSAFVSAGYYRVVSGGTAELVVHAQSGSAENPGGVFLLTAADPENLIVSAVARGRDGILLRNTQDPAGRFPQIRLSDFGISSVLAIPLILGNRCDAVLVALIAGENREFTDLGITRLNTFADFAALTIDHHRRYSEILEKGKAEYQALQSQVQPHFINNVLSALFALNRQGETKILEASLLSFRKMLSYVQDGRRDTTLGEEFDFLKEYIELQKLRFGERLNCELIVREGTRNVVIPRLLLQPLVENAVIHGIEPLDRPGRLVGESSWSYREGIRILEIEIRDDGAGLPAEVLHGGGRIGIPNVRARLGLTYPGARFSVASRDGEGTRIRIEIDKPLMIGEGN